MPARLASTIPTEAESSASPPTLPISSVRSTRCAPARAGADFPRRGLITDNHPFNTMQVMHAPSGATIRALRGDPMALTPLPAELPSLQTMPPQRWVAQMRALRERVADAAALVLDLEDTPEGALPQLQPIFDAYTKLKVGADADYPRNSNVYVEIRVADDALRFWVFPTRNYKSVVFTEMGYWWADHAGVDERNPNPHLVHRALMLRVLQMIPWANDDNIDQLAAIEAATRAG